MTITTIPAQPDFDLVLLTEDGAHPPFIFYPIIAWTIETEVGDTGEYVSSTVHPVCTGFNWNTLQQNIIIRRPSGEIEFGDNRVFPHNCAREALDYAKQRRERQRKLTIVK